MFKTSETSEKHPEDPPAYSKASTVEKLSDTSHGVRLTVSTPSSEYYVPGSNLDARLSIPPDVLSGIVGDVDIRMEAKSSVEIMGKPRYQVRSSLWRTRRMMEIGECMGEDTDGVYSR
jgi:hypothetical protein